MLLKIYEILLWVIPLLIAVILHEISHGIVALKLGDPTAKNLKRLSLNPIRHIDPFMTVILPSLLVLSGSNFIFGAAKPVPVNPLYFKKPRQGMALVALAGPLCNIILAIFSLILLHAIFAINQNTNNTPITITLTIIAPFFQYSVIINLILALFNLIPIPPLDGGRILTGILPKKLAFYYAKLERFGFVLVILFIMSDVFQKIATPILKAVEKLLF